MRKAGLWLTLLTGLGNLACSAVSAQASICEPDSSLTLPSNWRFAY